MDTISAEKASADPTDFETRRLFARAAADANPLWCLHHLRSRGAPEYLAVCAVEV